MSEVHEQNIQLRNTVDEIHDDVAHQGRLIKDLRESQALEKNHCFVTSKMVNKW